MFPKHKKLLKQIINEYYKTSCKIVTSYNLPMEKREVEYLAAKNLVNIKNYTDGEFAVTLTSLGITYFDDRREQLICFWVPTAISIIALLKSFQSEIILLLQLLVQILK